MYRSAKVFKKNATGIKKENLPFAHYSQPALEEVKNTGIFRT